MIPLPDRPGYEGVGPARVRLHGGLVAAELASRFGVTAHAKVLAGEVFCADGSLVNKTTTAASGTHVFLYRDLPDEVTVPFDTPILYRDEDIVVVDKPHFLATMPRGGHVVQTALVQLRRELGLPELSPAHRLDRLTAGVLLFTTRQAVRGRYQTLFARGQVHKLYEAVAYGTPNQTLPASVCSRIVKQRGVLQAREEPGEPNAETLVQRLSGDLYRLTPRTGRTHQLRVHLNRLGVPIVNDPLYPVVKDIAPDDFSTPLQLLARSLEFDDPITGRPRRFVSARRLSALGDG